MKWILLAALASLAPPEAHAPTQHKVVLCGPMFDNIETAHLDPITEECVERVLAHHDIGVVLVPCPDLKLHPMFFWINARGVQAQTFDEVCD